jgi:hypothetical protein
VRSNPFVCRSSFDTSQGTLGLTICILQEVHSSASKDMSDFVIQTPAFTGRSISGGCALDVLVLIDGARYSGWSSSIQRYAWTAHDNARLSNDVDAQAAQEALAVVSPESFPSQAPQFSTTHALAWATQPNTPRHRQRKFRN